MVPRPELPAQSTTAVGGIAAGAELRAGPGVSVLAALLDRMAYTKLRHTYGLAYVVRCRPIVVGPHQRFVALVADVAEDVAAHAASMLVDDVTRLGEGGVTDEAVAVAKADIARRGAIDPLALLLGAARADLLTREGRTAAENLEAVERVGRGEVGALAAELARRLIVAVPSGANVHGLPTLRHVGVPGPGDGSMTLRPDRVEYADEQGGVEVYFARCAAALRQPDGSLALVGLDGQSLVVHPDLSDGGSQALVTVEQALEPRLFVPAPGRSTEDDARERQVRASVPRRDGSAVGSPTAPGHVTWRRSGPD